MGDPINRRTSCGALPLTQNEGAGNGGVIQDEKLTHNTCYGAAPMTRTAYARKRSRGTWCEEMKQEGSHHTGLSEG